MIYKVALALTLGWDASHVVVRIVLGSAFVLIVATTLVYAVFEQRSRHRIRDCRVEPGLSSGGV